jgi:4-amino-4-deoxy-L-arabinose transferase-like glycosyltransferase
VHEPLKGAAQGWPAAGLILAVTLPLFLVGLGERHIWIPLEARYALVARDMMEGGHWILPHLGGELYPDKPPLLFWSIALLSTLTAGVSEWTARLPSALAAVAVCLVTWRFGAQLFSPTAGLLASLSLATSAGFFWSGRQALPDMLLTLWTTSACWALWQWVATKRPWAAPLAGTCLGLATLSKGPVGFLLPLFTVAAYLTVRRDGSRPRGQELWLCFGAFMATTLAWYLPALWQGGLSYAEATLLHHSVERYVKAWEHTAPWYFYLGAFPAEFLPWTLFLPQAFAYGIARRGRVELSGWWFAVCWLATILLFFSLSSGKRDIYILPAFPAAALLVGWAWSRWVEQSPRRADWWAWSLPSFILSLGLWGGAGGIWAAAGGLLPTKSVLLLPIAPEARFWTGLLLAFAGSLLLGVPFARRVRLVYACMVGCTWCALMLAVIWIYTPQFNQRYSIKAFAAAVQASVPPHQSLRLCGPLNDLALRFNMGRDVPLLTDDAEIKRYLDREQRVFCVLTQTTYRRLDSTNSQPFPILARHEIDRSAWLLIANQP